MSDAPAGAGWWCAADGKWYPPPFPAADAAAEPMSDAMPSRPPTPAPDHPPTTMRVGASGFPSHQMPDHPHPKRSKALFAVSAVAVVLAIAVVTLTFALLGRGPGNVRTASAQYDLVLADVQDAEDTNLTFVDTFWQTYSTYVAQWRSASPERRAAITQQFFDDVDAEIAQFRVDLQSIDGSLVSRAFDDGTAADDIRDAAVNHYRSWDAWAHEVPAAARSWSSSGTSVTLDEWIDTKAPTLSNDINDTFDTVCETLASDQPSDGSYEDTIAEICS